MSELLKMHGIDVIGKAYNGLEAVELFNQLHPDVVLLDLMMPKYDGLYALKKIREIDPNSVILIVTGGATPSLNTEVELLKPNQIIFKPFDVNSLVEVILEKSDNALPFKIQYSFKEDPISYTCVLTYEQYKNFKELPVINECQIINNGEKNIEAYKQEMQEALNMAAKNDISYIQKLSQIIS
jgi:YesN/AraC family two-component response regulator